MMLIDEAGVPDAALPVTEFTAHLRLGTGFSAETLQEPVLRSFLRAAIAAIEARTAKALVRRVFALTVHDWAARDAHPLPVAPVTRLVSLGFRDRAGTETASGLDVVWLAEDAHRPVLRAAGGALPAIPRGQSAVLRFEAGYAAAWGELPADLGQAVLLLAAHYYEYRDATSLGGGCMPFGVTSLIERYRALRLHAGAGR
ncbi:head-tail connector protein [Rhodosalinus sp. 5P4]|uniref:head-tail connector protein n=1 Tax=Rhodosalinus sp. 5P4 TaxID=3239196 RepID=UPI003526ADBF